MGSSQGDQVEVGTRLFILMEGASFFLLLDSLVALVAHLVDGEVVLLD